MKTKSSSELKKGSKEQSRNVCSICQATFVHLAALRGHMLKHVKLRTYVCRKRGAKFAHSSAIKGHVLSNNEARKHSCSFCEAKFTLLSALKGHMLKHIGVRKHLCSKCNARFTNYSALKGHTLSEHVFGSQCNSASTKATHQTKEIQRGDVKEQVVSVLEAEKNLGLADDGQHYRHNLHNTFSSAEIHGSQFVEIKTELQSDDGMETEDIMPQDELTKDNQDIQKSTPIELENMASKEKIKEKKKNTSTIDNNEIFCSPGCRSKSRKSDEPHFCQDCKFISLALNDVRQQMTKHRVINKKLLHEPEKGRFLCTLCGIKFDQSRLLNRHIARMHKEDRMLLCTMCGDKFNCESTLKNHIQKKHENSTCSSL